MLTRLFFIILGFGCLTTFIAFQQTRRYRLRYDEVVSNVYRRFSHELEENNVKTKAAKTKSLHNKRTDTKDISNVKNSLKEQYYNELRNSEPFTSTKENDKYGESADHYLLPILYYNMGPNNLFRIFKEVVPIAFFMKRTLVIPPFHHHPRMKRAHETQRARKSHNTVDVDIFDQTYTSVMENDPEKIIDMPSLRHLMPAATIQEFRQHCGHKMETLITCGSVRGKRSNGLDHFKKAMNISIGRVYAVDDFCDITEDKKLKVNLLSSVRKTKDDSCIGLALGSKCLGNRKTWFMHWKRFSPFVRLPPEVMILAKQFVTAMFQNQPFVAAHWRYENEDWQDMCKESRPDSVRKINRPMCEMAAQLSNNATALHVVAARLRNYASKKGYRYMYIAGPPQILETLRRLKKEVPGLYIVSDVKDFSETNHIMPEIFDNNFSTSFLEQALCCVADMFLGSPLSSWTQTVMLDRTSAGKDNHASILDVVVEDTSSFPKLTWYFPEGA